MAGRVLVNGQPANKPGQTLPADSDISIADEKNKYASRAGLKLEGALEDFAVNPNDAICLDIGASNGGFTDCLLQHGARFVFTVDVNTAQLDWKLRQDPRVVSMKKNARFLKQADIPELASLIVIDVSFISVAKILAPAARCAGPDAQFLILVKPQFELPKRFVGEGGIIRDPAAHGKAVATVTEAALRAGLEVLAIKPSRLPGAEGNLEFFLHARRSR